MLLYKNEPMNIWEVEKQYYYNLAKIMYSLIFDIFGGLFVSRKKTAVSEVSLLLKDDGEL